MCDFHPHQFRDEPTNMFAFCSPGVISSFFTFPPVKIDVDEDEIRRPIDAVYHYEAYLHSQQRDEVKFRELLVRLRKVLGKPRTRGSE